MLSARAFTERLATALLSLVATGMAVGGVALAGLGAALRQTPFDIAAMPVVTGGLMALGATLGTAGGVALVWARGGPSHSGAHLLLASGARMFVLLAATALPLALATQLGPLAGYWRDVWRLASAYDVWDSANGPTGLVFVPAMGVLLVPTIEAITAVMVALSCGLLLALMLARSAATVKLSAIAALLAGGLTISGWVGAGVTERLAPGAETLIRTTADPRDQEQERALALLQRHRAVVGASARTLSWAWIAVALLAAGTRTLSKVVAGADSVLAGAATHHSLDATTRAKALLDAAQELHRTTPPVRRY